MNEISDVPHVEPDSAIARLVSGFAEAVALLNAETGRIAYWNQAAEALSGLEAREIVGRPFVELLAPEARADFAQRLQLPAAPFVLDLLGAGQKRLAIELSLNRLPDGARSWPLVILRRFQSEEHRLLDTAFQGVLRVDAESRVTYANARMAEMLGYVHGELEGKSLFELVPPDQLEALNTYVARRREGINEQFEFCMARQDGSPLWTLVTTNPLQDTAGRYIGAIAMITDLHERRAAEVALRESEELWRSLLEYAPQWVLLIDRNRTIQFISRDVRAEALGHSIYDFTPPDEHATLKACYDTIFDEARPVHYESHVVNPDGTRRWLAAHVGPVILRGEVRYALAIVEDIHERKEAEVRLRRSEQQLANAQQLAQIGSWEYFPETNSTEWSDEIYRIFGRPSELPGLSLEPFLALVHPEDRGRTTDGIARSLAAAGSSVHDFRIVRADGGVRFIRARADSLHEDGKLVRVVGVMQDVTELKQAYEEVALRTAELERAQQLNALKNNFVNSVSHELRTPLTSILGYAEFLEDEVAGPVTDGQREFVREIVSGARRLEHLVDDLLDFARIDAGTFRLRPIESNFAAKVREIVASLAPQAIAGQLHLEVGAPETLTVLMDPQRIGQVLINLLTNAVKFTAAGGHIRVSARVEGDRLLCEVQDTGEGIAPEQLDKLFLRFSQLPGGARRGGAGLGLSISKTLVEMHGGTIGVRSELGLGSTFWFMLPLGGPA